MSYTFSVNKKELKISYITFERLKINIAFCYEKKFGNFYKQLFTLYDRFGFEAILKEQEKIKLDEKFKKDYFNKFYKKELAKTNNSKTFKFEDYENSSDFKINLISHHYNVAAKRVSNKEKKFLTNYNKKLNDPEWIKNSKVEPDVLAFLYKVTTKKTIPVETCKILLNKLKDKTVSVYVSKQDIESFNSFKELLKESVFKKRVIKIKNNTLGE